MISQHPHYGFELPKTLVGFVFCFLSELGALCCDFWWWLRVFWGEISPFSLTVLCTPALHGLSYWAYFFLLWICVAMLGSGGSGWCWSGMVSLALKWLLPAREPCHFCTPRTASAFWRYLPRSFRMRISFQGRTTRAHMHIKNSPQKTD